MSLLAELEILQQDYLKKNFIETHLYCTGKNFRNSLVLNNLFESALKNAKVNVGQRNVNEMLENIKPGRPDFAKVRHYLNMFNVMSII